MFLTATWEPPGVVSTMLPSPELTDRMSPLGAMARPSGWFKFPPMETVRPVPALVRRKTASGIAAMRFEEGVRYVERAIGRQSQTCRADDQGSRIGALFETGADDGSQDFARHAPFMITILFLRDGQYDSYYGSSVDHIAVGGYRAVQSMVTNSSAKSPRSRAVISHGPLMRTPNWVPENVSTTLPWLFKTSRQPALAVAEVPSVVGRLPTITQPLRSTDKAVVRPIPQGPGRFAALSWAKTLSVPLGAMSTMVVPVPCRFWLLLELLTRTWPRTSFPELRGTTATP